MNKKTFVGVDQTTIQSGSTVLYSGNTWISELLTKYTLYTDFYNLTANTYTKSQSNANFLSATTLNVAANQVAFANNNQITGSSNLLYISNVLTIKTSASDGSSKGLEIKNSATTSVMAVYDNGTLEKLSGSYYYHRQVLGTDTEGDWREYINGDFILEKYSGGTWVEKGRFA